MCSHHAAMHMIYYIPQLYLMVKTTYTTIFHLKLNLELCVAAANRSYWVDFQCTPPRGCKSQSLCPDVGDHYAVSFEVELGIGALLV